MEINISYTKDKIAVTVVSIKGDLDASSYLELVNTVQLLYDEGTKYLILDLTDLAFISSAGLASLHIIDKMFHGERADSKAGWGNYKDIGPGKEDFPQSQVKLLNPSPEVGNVLDTTGFMQFFEVYKSLNTAIKSFSKKAR